MFLKMDPKRGLVEQKLIVFVFFYYDEVLQFRK